MESSGFDLDKSDGVTAMEVDSGASGIAGELEALKASGNALVGRKEWAGALAEYGKAIELSETKHDELASDFDAERRGERCILAVSSNMALCALKMKEYGRAKSLCAQALERHERARRPDPSGKAKVLFRRGQAFMGLGDPRMSIDSFAAAIDIEEQLLGASSKDAAMKADDSQRVATIQSMKRELVKARKAANAAEKESVSKGHKGFLNVKRISDPKSDRREILLKDLDRVFEGVWTNDRAGFGKVVDGILSRSRDIYEQTEADTVNRARAAFVRAFAAFVAGEVRAADSKHSLDELYATSAEDFERYWKIRESHPEDDDLLPPLGLSDAVAREASGHVFMRMDKFEEAKECFEKYLAAQKATGEIPAYHNLPDSFLLQRGMNKMTEADRRAHRWKNRCYSHRSVFDAQTSLTAISKELGQRDEALKKARECLELAQDNEERKSAHRNLEYLLSFAWDTAHPTEEEKAESIEHGNKVKEMQKLIDEEKAAEEAKKQKEQQNSDAEEPPEIEEEEDIEK